MKRHRGSPSFATGEGQHARDGQKRDGEMPKEVIAMTTIQDDNDPERWEATGLAVSWGADGTVTVASRRTESGDAGEVQVVEEIAEFLNRDQVNHLIRTLRRARERVFGRDE